jgi:indolepyruvate decarboxylase
MSGFTVGDHLLARLSEVGVRHVFGVPGDYNLAFLDHVLEHPQINWVGAANELNAAYASDGYARINGVGALVTTYGVGELSAANGIAGAYAEYVPVIHIVGAPSTSVQRLGALMHHTLGDGDYTHFVRMHAEITVAHAVLESGSAVSEIDRVLGVCLRERRPVYLVLPTDVAAAAAEAPDTPLRIPAPECDTGALERFLAHARELLSSAATATVLADFLADRFGVASLVRGLVDTGHFPFSTLMLGKAVLDESDSRFAGIYVGSASGEGPRAAIEEADAVIAVGVRFTDIATAGFSHNIAPERLIDMQPFEARIGAQRYGPLPMAEAVAGLARVAAELGRNWRRSLAPEPLPEASEKPYLCQQDLWNAIQGFLSPGDIVVAEQGTSYYGAFTLRMPPGATFIGQSLWGSIGYTLPAAFGAQTAAPDRRVLLFIGDGSMLLTAQELGMMIRDRQRPIIVLVNNDGYTIERAIHGADQTYNDIPRWNWSLLAEAMGGAGETLALRADTSAKLADALASAANEDQLTVLEVVLGRLDVPALLATLLRKVAVANAAAD